MRATLTGCVVLWGCGRTPVELDTSGERASCGIFDEVPACESEDARAADRVLRYDPTYAGDTVPADPDYVDPDDALGARDYSGGRGAVSLGNGGLLELAFDGCMLANGGDDEPDIVVYEVGPFLETALVRLRATDDSVDELDVDSEGFVSVGSITGPVELDIDAAFPGHEACSLRFTAVRLEDDPSMGGWNGLSTGADIDALELLAVAWSP